MKSNGKTVRFITHLSNQHQGRRLHTQRHRRAIISKHQSFQTYFTLFTLGNADQNMNIQAQFYKNLAYWAGKAPRAHPARHGVEPATAPGLFSSNVASLLERPLAS